MWKPSKRGEIIPGGKEIYKNNQYEKLISWASLKDVVSQDLTDLLSIKVVQCGPSMQQYNIETKDHYTNLTTTQGLDIILTQIDKKTKKLERYSPYSSPAYKVFIYMACAYFEIYGKKPILEFPYTDEESWIQQAENLALPLKECLFAASLDRGLSSYMNHRDQFKVDEKGIWRTPEEMGLSGFGLKDKTVILYLHDQDLLGKHHSYEIYIPQDLLHMFMQIFIDVNRSVSGPIVNLHVKKIHNALFDTLDTPDRPEENDIFFRKIMTPKLS